MTKKNSLVGNFDAIINKHLQAALEEKASFIKLLTSVIESENVLQGFSLDQQHLVIEREPFPRAEREEDKWFEPIYRICFVQDNPKLASVPKKWNLDVYIKDEKSFHITQYDGTRHDFLQKPNTEFKTYATELETTRNLLEWVENECDLISVNLALTLSKHISSNLENTSESKLFLAWSMADRKPKQPGWVSNLLRGNGDGALTQEMSAGLKEARELVADPKLKNTRTPK